MFYAQKGNNMVQLPVLRSHSMYIDAAPAPGRKKICSSVSHPAKLCEVQISILFGLATAAHTGPTPHLFVINNFKYLN
jgi:hypothetical protein